MLREPISRFSTTFHTPALCTQSQNLQHYASPYVYFPSVKNSRSPISPKPGLIMPFSSTSSSHPPTHTSTPSSHSPHALANPSSVAKIAHTIILLTPQSFSVSIAAHAVAPVAITGSTMIASSGCGGLEESAGEVVVEEDEVWYGKLL